VEAGVTDAFDGTGRGDGTADRDAREIDRFTAAERWVHRATAVLMLTLIATGMVLYLPSLSVRIGHRQDVALIHLYSGWSLPIPMAAGLFSRAYRADARRLNRHTEEDRRWLRVRGWREGSIETFDLRVGKFNAGQKLNAAFMCGAIIVMAVTGTMMWFPHLVSVSMRTGATFVHDWLALAIGFVVIGHLWFAFSDPGARRGMRRGRVTRTWARRMHPGWVAELDAAEEAGRDGGRAQAGRSGQAGKAGPVRGGGAGKQWPGGSAGRN
jgi:formate dehydrogenase subunit gamma